MACRLVVAPDAAPLVREAAALIASEVTRHLGQAPEVAEASTPGQTTEILLRVEPIEWPDD